MNKDKLIRRSFLLLGLVFALTALLMGYSSVGKPIQRYLSSSQWVEVPATLHELELVSHRGDSTTYSMTSRYSYRHNGSDYEGDRVSFDSGSDNVGSYWQDLHQSLNVAQASNEASAFVNPDVPSESVLDRTLRWDMIAFASVFIFMFAGIGAFFIWLARQLR